MASFSSSFGPLPSREGAVDYSASLGTESMSSFLASLVPPEDVNNDVDGGDITGGSLSSSVKPLSALFSLIPPPAPGQDGRKEIDEGNQSQASSSSSLLTAPPPPPPAPQGEGNEAIDEVRECNSPVCLARKAALEAILQLVLRVLG